MPKQIDQTMEFNSTGKFQKITSVGIYRLEGDTLVVCQTFPLGGDLDSTKLAKRPTGFETTADNLVIREFKRMQEPKP